MRWLAILHLILLSATGGESPAPAIDLTTSTSLLVTGRLTCAVCLIVLLVPTLGSSNGISNHTKLLDSNANFEEFEVDNPEKHLHIKGQTLRLYNPDSHQWSIYLLDLDKGVLSVLQPSVNSMATAVNSTIRNSTKGARSWCAMSG